MNPAVFLREARHSARMTQAELAERLGVSQPVVARLERSDANPTWDTLVRALNATGHTVELKRRRAPAIPLDIDQLRERLRLTPAERLMVFQTSQRELDRLHAKARRRGA